jgi:hypothetical protein
MATLPGTAAGLQTFPRHPLTDGPIDQRREAFAVVESPQGFYVLRLTCPASAFDTHWPSFQRLKESFRPTG